MIQQLFLFFSDASPPRHTDGDQHTVCECRDFSTHLPPPPCSSLYHFVRQLLFWSFHFTRSSCCRSVLCEFKICATLFGLRLLKHDSRHPPSRKARLQLRAIGPWPRKPNELTRFQFNRAAQGSAAALALSFATSPSKRFWVTVSDSSEDSPGVLTATTASSEVRAKQTPR